MKSINTSSFYDSNAECSIEELIPEFIRPCSNSLLLESEWIVKQNSWLSRLDISEKLGVGFAAPGGFFTRAVYEGVVNCNLSLSLERFKNTVIVELGAGGFHYGYELAVALGASAYVGVEPFYFDALYYALRNRHITCRSKVKSIPWAVVPYDMLSFLQGVPGDSISLFTFGIERCILGDERYRKKVELEMQRVLSPIGGYLSFVSDLELTEIYSEKFSVWRKKEQEIGRLFLK